MAASSDGIGSSWPTWSVAGSGCGETLDERRRRTRALSDHQHRARPHLTLRKPREHLLGLREREILVHDPQLALRSEGDHLVHLLSRSDDGSHDPLLVDEEDLAE